MVTVVVERRYGHTTVRSRVSAPSVERALQLCGAHGRVVFPIDPEGFFASRSADGLTRASQRSAQAA